MSPSRRAFVFACVGLALVYADQNLIAPHLTAIAEDLNLSLRDRDTKLGGEIAFAFFLLGAPASLLLGALADKFSRVKLFAWTLLLGSTPNCLALFITTYTQLYWLRALTGIAVGGAAPLTYSLCSDLFPASERTRMSAVTGISMSLGVVGGQAISGFIGQKYGWRVPFAVVAAPGFVVAILMMFFAEEPVRGAMEDESEVIGDEEMRASRSERETLIDAPSRSHGSTPPPRGAKKEGFIAFYRKVVGILSVKTVALFLVQGIAGCVPWSMINTFFNDYLAQDKKVGVELSTTLLIAFAVGAMASTLVSGLYGQKLYNENPKKVSYFMGSTAIIGVVPIAYLILADYNPASKFDFACKSITAFLAGFIASCVGVNIRAVLLNVLHPLNRGTAFSLFMLTDDLGKGLGPVFVAGLVDILGRERAFFVSVLFWIPCGFILLASASTVLDDLKSVQNRYKAAQAESEFDERTE